MTDSANNDSEVGERMTVLGVDYTPVQTADGGALYMTDFGLPFREHLEPVNWYAHGWFDVHRVRLDGTSVIYRIPTRPVRGLSLPLVARFNRVGETVPLNREILYAYPHAEFNSPFEEIAMAMRLRRPQPDATRTRILTKRPLAIFAPAGRLQLWQTGRRDYVFDIRQSRHPEAPIDILQLYVILYGWVRGTSALEAPATLGSVGEDAEAFINGMMELAARDLRERGLQMIDLKPQHLVLRFNSTGKLVRHADGDPAYVLVDYELVEPIPAADITLPQ